MKIRTDFVTNSSSSSFIIAKKYLDEDQIKAIRNHEEMAEKLNLPYAKYDDWQIEESNEFITGCTYIDNFMIEDLLEKIDVNMNYVQWGEYSFDLETFNSKEYAIFVKTRKEQDEISTFDWREFL